MRAIISTVSDNCWRTVTRREPGLIRRKRRCRTPRRRSTTRRRNCRLPRTGSAIRPLTADGAGTVTARGAEPGEVVQAGQMIVRVARQGGLDAVFDVPAQVLRAAPAGSQIAVRLADDPTVTTTGRVREVAPQADPVTRTFEVKVALDQPPAAMRLGATVVGSVTLRSAPGNRDPRQRLDAVQSPARGVDRRSKKPYRLAAQHRIGAARTGGGRSSAEGWTPATLSSPPGSRRCIQASRSGCSDRPRRCASTCPNGRSSTARLSSI